ASGARWLGSYEEDNYVGIFYEDYAGKVRLRGFEVVANEHRWLPEVEVKIPTRGTQQSAGYDFYALEDTKVPGHGTAMFPTDIKAYMQGDEVLRLYPRSSMGIKRGFMLANTVPTIDADYYGNKDNDGNIVIVLRNLDAEDK